MAEPKRGVAYDFSIELPDAAVSGKFKINPTIAEGDFKISKDNGDFTNLDTLPVVSPVGGVSVKVSLSTDEMVTDKIKVTGIDAAGNEWLDVSIFIDVTLLTVDDPVVLSSVLESIYRAEITLSINETTDEYTVIWIKNGFRITTGIILSTIQVIKQVNGIDLIPTVTILELGSTGRYKHNETINRTVVGEEVLVIVKAIIDSGRRSFTQLISRDSS